MSEHVKHLGNDRGDAATQLYDQCILPILNFAWKEGGVYLSQLQFICDRILPLVKMSTTLYLITIELIIHGVDALNKRGNLLLHNRRISETRVSGVHWLQLIQAGKLGLLLLGRCLQITDLGVQLFPPLCGREAFKEIVSWLLHRVHKHIPMRDLAEEDVHTLHSYGQ